MMPMSTGPESASQASWKKERMGSLGLVLHVRLLLITAVVKV